MYIYIYIYIYICAEPSLRGDGLAVFCCAAAQLPRSRTFYSTSKVNWATTLDSVMKDTPLAALRHGRLVSRLSVRAPPHPTLETTQEQINDFFSQFPLNCYLSEVASVGA